VGASSRTRYLARTHPGSRVWSGAVGIAPRRVVHAARESAVWPEAPLTLPSAFSFLADDEGLSFWSTVSEPFLSLPWSVISSIEVAQVTGDRGYSFRGLGLTIAPHGHPVTLPIVIMRKGILGVFPARDRELEQIRIDLTARIVGSSGEGSADRGKAEPAPRNNPAGWILTLRWSVPAFEEMVGPAYARPLRRSFLLTRRIAIGLFLAALVVIGYGLIYPQDAVLNTAPPVLIALLGALIAWALLGQRRVAKRIVSNLALQGITATALPRFTEEGMLLWYQTQRI
jgi:hypothetical protein